MFYDISMNVLTLKIKYFNKVMGLNNNITLREEN